MKRLISMLLALALLAGVFTAVAVTASAKTIATHIGIVKARGGLRLREDASTSSKILATAPYGDYVVVLEKKGDWYRVNYNLQIGYMSGDYLTLKEKENIDLGIGKVTSSVVNIRTSPNTSSKVVHQVKKNDTVEIFGFNCGWYKVNSKNQVGYIRSDLVELTEKPAENFGVNRGNSSSGSSSSGSSSTTTLSKGEKLAAYAKTFVGYPYVYGGSSPSGFDCSGFMQYVHRQMGYTIKRTATAQLSNGRKVTRDELKPGDMVFFGYGSTATHVGMYIGGGKFVHAENSGTGVVISELFTGYYSGRYLTARRIVD